MTKQLPGMVWLAPALVALIGCGDDASTSTQPDGGFAPPVADAGGAADAQAQADAAPDGPRGNLGGPLAYTSEFTTGGVVPPRHKCLTPIGGGAGENISPLLEWTGGPEETQSFGLVLFDATFDVLHWVVWDIPAAATSLPEGIPPGRDLLEPAGAHQDGPFQTDGEPAYFGPCTTGSIAGDYDYRLYALDVESLPVDSAVAPADVQAAIEEAALDSVIWTGKPE